MSPINIVNSIRAEFNNPLTIRFIDEIDERATPIGGKGIDELGATGVVPAVANAVFAATGKRDLPIKPDKLLSG